MILCEILVVIVHCVFGTHLKLELSRNVVDQRNQLQLRFELLRGFYNMCKEFGNNWVEYMDPIHLMDHPSNMGIGLCWYQEGTNNKWTYNLTDRLMVDLRTTIALASMTYIVDLNAYGLI